MGEARRERLRLGKERLRLIHGGKRDEADKILVPPAMKPQNMLLLHVLVLRDLKNAIDELYEFVQGHFQHRNDFLVAVLEDGLRGAAEAYQAALKQKVEAAQPQVALVPATGGVTAEEIAARLRALKGEPTHEPTGA
jgi:hypothetical protein